MAKDFLKLKTDSKRLSVFVFSAGMILSISMGAGAYRDARIQNGYELARNSAGGGAYKQEVIASMEGYDKMPVTVTVEEEKFSKEEAEKKLVKAEKLLDDILKGDNESLSQVTGNLNFADRIPETSVEVEWLSKNFEYFYSDGTRREDIEISEPIELQISAILSCQEYFRDYETVITLLPREMTEKEKFVKYIEQQSEQDRKSKVLVLPKTYQENFITWKRPVDYTFLSVFFLTILTVLLLKVGGIRDSREEKRLRLEELEKDYAQIVSKFTMLLSAGLSVRNAWERIVGLYRGTQGEKKAVYEEMNRALKEMQKGVSELEVYERFGIRVGQVHYKKMMALFISDKKRGSINLLEAMEQEMMQAWEEQKRKTRQQGEKIGTRLLIPMMGMLAVVFIMILVPAFLSFQL